MDRLRGWGRRVIAGDTGAEASKITLRKEARIMKSTGIVRKVDELGRVVLPIELRRTLDINEKDSLEIFVDGSQIMLKKYEPACIFCQSSNDVITYNGKNICKSCLQELANLLQ